MTQQVRRFNLASLTTRRLAIANLFATLVLNGAAAVPAIATLPIVQASTPAVTTAPDEFAAPPSSAASGSVVWRAGGGYQLSDSEIYKAAVLAEAQRQAQIQAMLDYQAALQAQQADEENAAISYTEAPAPVSVYGINGSYVIRNARITFYSCTGEGFCGGMASGDQVYEGAVACSEDIPLGTPLRILSDPSGRVFVCLDRGLLSPTWIDVFFYNAADGWAWQSVVGTISDIEILQ